MSGFLVPPWFHEQEVDDTTMNVASIFWGFSIAFSIFTAVKGVQQSWYAWRRSGRITAYVAMIWGNWFANALLAILNWLYLWGSIEASFWLWFFILVIWVFQTQLIIQIIINRISLLMMVKAHAQRLKWGAFAIIACINIIVFCVWIPARLQISPKWVATNNVWDRLEKTIFLILDACLNSYFVILVRTRLIQNGLTKYNKLFNMNCVMIAISISMDVCLIGLMSLPNSLVYLQFQSIAYLTKLHIEMNLADLIKKVARATTHGGGDELSSGVGGNKSSSGQGTVTHKGSQAPAGNRNFLASISRGANQPYGGNHTTHIELGSDESLEREARGVGGKGIGIHKTTVVTQTIQEPDGNTRRVNFETPISETDDTSSVSSSEKELRPQVEQV